MKRLLLFLLIVMLTACEHDRKVNTSFYYWKTIYEADPLSQKYQHDLEVNQLYVRIMDVDKGEDMQPRPVSPITFRDQLPDTVKMVPVVFIVNDVLKNMNKPELNTLSRNIVEFTDAKAHQGGKADYSELQIDCDWTATTRENYFYLLRQIAAQPQLKGKKLTATLRLHQLKNLRRNGLPPVNRVMLMCYNMGNLRKYGSQNSIIDLNELKKYAGSNVHSYPLPMDIGLPLFRWAVVFRNQQYAGISKRVTQKDILNKNQFKFIEGNLYRAEADMPQFGILKKDEVRWEDVPVKTLTETAKYLSGFIKQDSLHIIYYHLDQHVIQNYTSTQLRQTAEIFR